MQTPSAESSVNKIVETIHEIARDHVPQGAQIGIVMKFEPPSIQIAVNNIVLDEKQLYLDQFLMSGYQRSTSGETSMTGVAGNLVLNNVSGTLTASNITT